MSRQPGVRVGIVSALPVESAAIRVLVDDLRPVPAKPNDRNQYQEGSLPSVMPSRRHGVVLVLLPQDGTGNASSVCADLFRSYPELECVVMCGIAGGIPSPNEPGRHVRLGDIVVAEEIVGYGHIRRVNGTDVLRRALSAPSSDLVRAANELRTNELAYGVQPWRYSLDGEDHRLKRFARPDSETDKLYVGGALIAHPDLSLTGHEPGWPKVHYGRIGSADVLMRDELRRDELASTHRIIAVEMEASGVASAAAERNRAWFVVRGIVDYCENTGKNDAWHPYASLAAAAYVRALLGACLPFGTDNVIGDANDNLSTPPVSRPIKQLAVDLSAPAYAFFAGDQSQLPTPPEYPVHSAIDHSYEWRDWILSTSSIYPINTNILLFLQAGADDVVTIRSAEVKVFRRIKRQRGTVIHYKYPGGDGAGYHIVVDTRSGHTNFEEFPNGHPRRMPPGTITVAGGESTTAFLIIQSEPGHMYEGMVTVIGSLNGEGSTYSIGDSANPLRWTDDLCIDDSQIFDWHPRRKQWVTDFDPFALELGD